MRKLVFPRASSNARVIKFLLSNAILAPQLPGLSFALPDSNVRGLSTVRHYHSVVSKFIVKDIELQYMKSVGLEALAARELKEPQKCFECGKQGHIDGESWHKNKTDERNTEREDTKGCFQYDKLGQIFKYCKEVRTKQGSVYSHSATLTSPSELLRVSHCSTSIRWNIDLARKGHISDDEGYVSPFTENRGMLQFENRKPFSSLVKKVREKTAVDDISILERLTI